MNSRASHIKQITGFLLLSLLILNLSLFCAGCAHQKVVTPGLVTPSLVTPSLATPKIEMPAFSSQPIPNEPITPAVAKSVQPVTTRRRSKSKSHHKHFRILLPIRRRLIITQYFYNTGYREHPGIDLAGYYGEPIYAATAGIVVYAGSIFHGYGNMVLLEFNKKWSTLYAHMSRILVRTGWRVRAGEQIGDMGETGNATGVHLHFELQRYKIPINPLPYLLRAERVAGFLH